MSAMRVETGAWRLGAALLPVDMERAFPARPETVAEDGTRELSSMIGLRDSWDGFLCAAESAIVNRGYDGGLWTRAWTQ